MIEQLTVWLLAVLKMLNKGQKCGEDILILNSCSEGKKGSTTTIFVKIYQIFSE